jgi:hypothetical protein
MSFWEGFNKYFGIQGIVALALVGCYIATIFTGVILPEGFTEIMFIVLGFFFGKNGSAYIQKAKGVVSPS